MYMTVTQYITSYLRLKPLLQNYIDNKAFSDAHHTDLWRAMQEEADRYGVKDERGNALHIKGIFDTWILQMGERDWRGGSFGFAKINKSVTFAKFSKINCLDSLQFKRIDVELLLTIYGKMAVILHYNLKMGPYPQVVDDQLVCISWL